MVVKLKRVIIENVKNTKYGAVDFSNNVMGIYGTSGLGKSTLLEVVELTSKLIKGEKIERYQNILSEEDARITVELEELLNGELTKVIYSYVLKGKYSDFEILEETVVIVNDEETKEVFKYRNGYEFDGKEAVFKDVLEILSDISKENCTSYIFNSGFRSIKISEELSEAVTILNVFSKNVLVYKENNLESKYISCKVLEDYKRKAKKISDVLGYIESGLSLELKETDRRLGSYQTDLRLNIRAGLTSDEVKIEYIVKKVEKNGIALQYESSGTKKLVNLVSYLVEVYNNKNAILLVDDIDRDMHEFLMGEILEVLSDGSRGQIIYTGHNLRALEVLPAEKLVFTTTNADNRYIKLAHKVHNNKRSEYIRALQLGGQAEELYNYRNSSSILVGLRKSGL